MFSPSPFIPQLDAILGRRQGAYSSKTLAGYRNDLKHFAAWCQDAELSWLPAKPQAIAHFVDEQTKTCAISTIKRRIEAIKFAHRISDLPSPVASSCVSLSLRRAARRNSARPKQSLGLTYPILERVLAACPDSLAGQRDAALLSVGYDALARSNELVLLEVGDVSDDQTSILIPRAKNDQVGQGRLVHLSPRSTILLSKWLNQTKFRQGPLFQGLHTGKASGKVLETSSVRRLIKSAARRAKLTEEVVSGLSGHSMRVGAAQDMMVAGLDHIAIMQAGGWTSIDVVARYVESAATLDIQERRWRSLS